MISSTAQLEFRPQRIGTEAQFVTEYTVYQDLLVKREQLQDSSNATAIAESQAAIEQSQAAIATLFESSELTGARVHDAYPQPLGDANKWEVVLTFDEEGTALFTDLTRNIAGTGRTLGIFLDEQLLSAPTVSVDYVETGITGGRASISGDFDARTATDLVVQPRSGSLPASPEMLEVATIKRDRNCKIGE